MQGRRSGAKFSQRSQKCTMAAQLSLKPDSELRFLPPSPSTPPPASAKSAYEKALNLQQQHGRHVHPAPEGADMTAVAVQRGGQRVAFSPCARGEWCCAGTTSGDPAAMLTCEDCGRWFHQQCTRVTNFRAFLRHYCFSCADCGAKRGLAETFTLNAGAAWNEICLGATEHLMHRTQQRYVRVKEVTDIIEKDWQVWRPAGLSKTWRGAFNSYFNVLEKRGDMLHSGHFYSAKDAKQHVHELEQQLAGLQQQGAVLASPAAAGALSAVPMATDPAGSPAAPGAEATTTACSAVSAYSPMSGGNAHAIGSKIAYIRRSTAPVPVIGSSTPDRRGAGGYGLSLSNLSRTTNL